MKSSGLKHPLAIARGLGSAKDGTGHWWAQRVTAVAMIPLGTWMIYMLVAMMRTGKPHQIQSWLENPLAAYPLALLLGLMFYHAKLGIQVVIEDYFHSPFLKYSLLMLNLSLCVIGGVASVVSILKLHFSVQIPIW